MFGMFHSTEADFLSLRRQLNDVPTPESSRVDTLVAAANEPHEQKIVVAENGPYLVSGGIPLAVQIITPNKEGFSWEWKQGKSFDPQTDYLLCRCGHSKTKPFCDQTHSLVGFNGKETATNATYKEQAEVIDGPSLKLSDAENLCAFARFCEAEGKIWNLIEKTDEPDTRRIVIRETMLCPSGRLAVQDMQTGQEIEHELPPSIGVVEDPVLDCSGPLWVRGAIVIESHDGRRYEKRNRVTLCRCGDSDNKPFCDGKHARN
jgi:CDGSH-type Zn-finger protein